MRHERVKCWADSYDAIVSGRKRADLRTLDRNFLVGDVVELVRWDPELGPDQLSIGTCEVMISHVERNAGPLMIFGMQHRIIVPLVSLSFVFLHASFHYPPLAQSTYCLAGVFAPAVVDTP